MTIGVFLFFFCYAEILLLFIVLFFFKIKTILTYAALAAIIHHIRPTLLDIDSLDER